MRTGIIRIPTLKYLIALAIGSLLTASEPTAPSAPATEYRLRMFHTHTHERLDIVYRNGAGYMPDALTKLDRFLRDSITGEVHHFDPRLFDLLADLTKATSHPTTEIQIICGYRTPSTNEYLRTHTVGVAKNSLHMQAEAIHIRLPDVKTSVVRQVALSMGRGGVGYYPTSNFVHVDVGRVRQW